MNITDEYCRLKEMYEGSTVYFPTGAKNWILMRKVHIDKVFIITSWIGSEEVHVKSASIYLLQITKLFLVLKLDNVVMDDSLRIKKSEILCLNSFNY